MEQARVPRRVAEDRYDRLVNEPALNAVLGGRQNVSKVGSFCLSRASMKWERREVSLAPC